MNGELPRFIGDAAGPNAAKSFSSAAAAVADERMRDDSLAGTQTSYATAMNSTSATAVNAHGHQTPTPPLPCDDNARAELLKLLQQLVSLVDVIQNPDYVLPRAALEQTMLHMIAAFMLVEPTSVKGPPLEMLHRCVQVWTANSKPQDCTLHKLLQFFVPHMQASLSAPVAAASGTP